MPYSSPHTASSHSSPIPPPPPNYPGSPSSTETTDLSDSFILISGSGDEEDDRADTDSTSTVSTALLADVSDTSSEPRYPGSLEGSLHGNFSDFEIDAISERDLGGSYTDAEATESILTDSRATLSASSNDIDNVTPLSTSMALPSTVRGSQSQFAFIFPHLEASISSSGTYTDNTSTPSGSLADLLPPTVKNNANPEIQRERGVKQRGEKEKSSGKVDAGWLKDARTWSTGTIDRTQRTNDDNKIILDMPSWGRGQYDDLTSVDSSFVAAPDRGLMPNKEDKSFLPAETRQRQLKQALEGLIEKGIKNANRRWGLIAFASCALAILGALGPNVIPLFTSNDSIILTNNTTAHPPVGPATGSTRPDLLSRTLHSTIPSSSTIATPRSLATQLIPDLQSIRDAISTFTFTAPPFRHDSPAPDQIRPQIPKDKDTSTFGWRKRKAATTLTSCCTGSTARNSVALTVPATNKGSLSVVDDTGYKAWMKAMANKVVRPTESTTTLPESANSSCNCNTSTSALSSSPFTNRYTYFLQRSRDYALTTTSAFAQLYQPMLLHLHHELGEIYRLATHISTHAQTQAAVRVLRSARQKVTERYTNLVALGRTRRARDIARMRQAALLISDTWSTLAERVRQCRSDEQEHVKMLLREAKEGLEKISAALQGTAGEVKIEGKRSVRQAKKGLDRLIRSTAVEEVKREVELEVEETKNDEKQRSTKWGHRIGTRREMRGRARRKVACIRENDNGCRMGSKKEPEGREVHQGRTKWRRLLDAVHHGAVQVVLQ